MLTGSGDDTAHLWRLSDASPLHVLRGHTDTVVAVALNHDASLAATASYDATVKVSRVRCSWLELSARSDDAHARVARTTSYALRRISCRWHAGVAGCQR